MQLARIINIQCGGMMVTPLDVLELPVEIIDAHLALAADLPDMLKARDKVHDYVEKFRKSHPTYRKHTKKV